MSDLYDETLDDIKQERSYKFFRKAIIYALVVLGVCVLVAGIYTVFHRMHENKIKEHAEQYFALQNNTSLSVEERKAELEKIASGQDNYAALAQFDLAQMSFSSGDLAAGVQLYKQISENNKYSKVLREAAFLQYISGAINNNMLDGVQQDIEVYLAGDQPIYKYLVMEFKAYLHLKQDEKDAAIAVFEQIVDDQDAPAAIADRVRAALSVI